MSDLDAAYLRDKAELCGVPEHLIDGLLRYIINRIEPGSCLTAVLENNLMESFGRADAQTAAGMKNICEFVYNYTPSVCHGSPAKVKHWLEGLS